VADFYNKIMICIGEANETVYWLEIINEMNWTKEEETKAIITEANELTALFTSIAIKLKNKKRYQ
jgi:four helix bundle protein